MKKQIKILEMGAEGGSISIIKTISPKGKESYFYATNEIYYDLGHIENLNRRSKNFSTFDETFNQLKNNILIYLCYISYSHILVLLVLY